MAAGEYHVVCAMFHIAANPLLYVLDSTRLLYVPANLFRVVDDRVSRYWHFGYEPFDGVTVGRGRSAWGYVEFVRGEEHCAKLFDGNGAAELIYQAWRERMTLEFALPHIVHRARAVGDGWVMCAACTDAWNPGATDDEMLRCPTCRELQHTPHEHDGDA